MRLLLVVHGYPPARTGGAELRAERTARALAARGHIVDVLTVAALDSAGGVFRQERSWESGVQVHRLHGIRAGNRSAYLEDDSARIGEAVQGLLESRPVDLVHQFSGYVTSAAVIRTARAHGVPVVVSLTDYWWLCRRVTLLTSSDERCEGPTPGRCVRCISETYQRWRWLSRTAPRLSHVFWNRIAASPAARPYLAAPPDEEERHSRLVGILNQASALISPSAHLAGLYVKYGVDPSRLHVRRQGVEAAVLPSRVASPVLRFGYLGQIKRHKGVSVLLDAWAALTGARARHLSLFGSDAGEPGYGRLVRRRMATLRDASWEGVFDPADRWNTLASLDVAVVPSRWLENSPNVILEAQFAGVVVVASRIGGIPELVKDGQNGLLVEPDSAGSLAAALQRLLDEPELLGRLQQGAPSACQPIAQEIAEIERIYRDVVATRAGPAEAPVAEAE